MNPMPRIKGEDQDLLMLWASTSLCFAHRSWHRRWVREEFPRQRRDAVACTELADAPKMAVG